MKIFPLLAIGVSTESTSGRPMDVRYNLILNNEKIILDNLGFKDSDQVQLDEINIHSEHQETLTGILSDKLNLQDNQKIVIQNLEKDIPISSIYDAYLKLYLLSLREVKPNSLNLDGIFNALPNIAWTNIGPVDPNEVEGMRAEHQNIIVKSVDKFPCMTDYVIPSGVRIADGSRFEEFKPLFGPTIICGFMKIHGHTVGVLGNNGSLFPDSSQKAAHFIQLCNQISIPLVFLQNITGFNIGKEFEQNGSIKKGAQMLNAVSNSEVPHLTVILGNSYGAGTYAMSGREFGNAFTFLWPTAKIAVMGGEQIAGVMSMVRRAKAMRDGLPFDEKEDARIVEGQKISHDKGSEALIATSAISDDGIIDPRDTRTVLGICLSVVNNKEVKGSDGFGVFRL